jgi:hypothetical protein
MKKLFFVITSCFILNVWADETDMAQDILKQIIHAPVNANPDISDEVADRTVILSLRASALTLACKQKNHNDEKAVSNCLSKNKPSLLDIGDLSESSFDVGQRSAQQQAQIHREVKVVNYYQVINLLMLYAKNIQHSDIPNLPKIN